MLFRSPFGHIGLAAVTFFIDVPFRHEIVFVTLRVVEINVVAGVLVTAGVGTATGFWIGGDISSGGKSFTLIEGEENVNPLTLKYSQPSFSLNEVVLIS